MFEAGGWWGIVTLGEGSNYTRALSAINEISGIMAFAMKDTQIARELQASCFLGGEE